MRWPEDWDGVRDLSRERLFYGCLEPWVSMRPVLVNVGKFLPVLALGWMLKLMEGWMKL